MLNLSKNQYTVKEIRSISPLTIRSSPFSWISSLASFTGEVEAVKRSLASQLWPGDVSWNQPCRVKMMEQWTNKLVKNMINMFTFMATAPSDTLEVLKKSKG